MFLVSAVMAVYIVSLQGWDNLGHRNDIREKLHFAVERMVRDVREAKAISVTSNALMLTLNESGSDNNYIYYLHNSSDSCPMTYSQATYDLRRTTFTSGSLPATLNCARFTYGSGEIIAKGLTPPTGNTSITKTGNYAALKLEGIEGNDKLTIRGEVRARNV